ncbi:MAG: DUF6361 family protein [Candidatus Sulfotelmatobacter sp.]
MSASLTWLDYDSAERDRMNRILALFRERDTRDELGVGVIRDLLADEFFPGTSTIQTRMRYMLFVPWIYQELEAQECESQVFAKEARKREVALVAVLSKSDDTAGVFGKLAGGELQRLPSSVYWAGLGKWGIRKFNGSQEQYQDALDAIYRARRTRRKDAEVARQRGEGNDADRIVSSVTWHSKIPGRPKDFPKGMTVLLTREEAEFIQDQITTSHPQSLLARMIFLPYPDADFPWEHPSLATFTAEHRQLLHHADLLSQVVYGAAILYNLMLSELKHSTDLVKARQTDARDWLAALDRKSLDQWTLDWVMPLAFKHRQIVSPHTMDFCRRWLEIVRSAGNAIMQDKNARALIRTREMRLKVGRSRFSNARALDQWRGAAGLSRMDFRWGTVRRFIADLREGLDEA